MLRKRIPLLLVLLPAIGLAQEHTHDHSHGAGPTSAPAVPPASAGETAVTVDVHGVTPAGRAPAPDVTVTLATVSQPGAPPSARRTARTDAAGRATFEGVAVYPGWLAVASASADGVSYESAPTPLTVGAPAALSVDTYGRSGDAAAIRVGRLVTEIFLWEGQLGVNQTWTFVNTGATTYDPEKGGPGVTIRLPSEAKSAHGRDAPETDFVVAGSRITYRGLVRPGAQHVLPVRVTWFLPYGSDTASFTQPSEYPIDDALTIVPEVPVVRDKTLAHLRLTASSPQHGPFDRQAQGPASFWVGRGLAAAPVRTLSLSISGLPHPNDMPMWAGILLCAVVLAWGVGRALSGRKQGAGRPKRAAPVAPSVPALAPEERRHLEARREKLYDRLVKLDRERGAGEEADEDAWERDRDAVKRRLIDVERRLEGA